MARLVVNGEPMGLRYLRDLWPKPMNVLLAGQSQTPVGLLSRAAADFAGRLRSMRRGTLPTNETIFLDTLPSIEVGAVIDGQPQWLNLIDSGDQPVAGHTRWHRFERLGGLTARAGKAALTLALKHEQMPTVHTVSAPLRRRTSQPRRFALGVALDPGQGHPRIEAVPLDGPSGGPPIRVDWRTLRDTGLTPDEYLAQAASGSDLAGRCHHTINAGASRPDRAKEVSPTQDRYQTVVP